MEKEKLRKKLKLWMVLHGMGSLNDFKKTNCNSVKCKYADFASGGCGSPYERRLLNDITLFGQKVNYDSNFGICITWLGE